MNTPNQSLVELARDNFEAMARNPYPGRGIVIGLNSRANFLIQVYWIMGRSENSQNRVFESEGGRLYTAPADPSKVKDPSLIIYNAMNEANGSYVVSNGDQTDDVHHAIKCGGDMSHGLQQRTYEPDKPNFTSRITAVSNLDLSMIAELSILRKSPWDDSCERHTFRYPTLGPGLGHCITTYSGDGAPLPAFRGEPILMPLEGTMDAIAESYWQMLNPDNRVSLAVKFISMDSGESSLKIINRFKKIHHYDKVA